MLVEQPPSLADAPINEVPSLSVESNGRRTPFLLALVSPWIGIIRPSKAGRLLADASWPAFMFMFVLHLALATVGVLFFAAWSESVDWDWTNTTGSPINLTLRERSIAQVIRDWYDPNSWDAIDGIVTIVPLVVLAAIIVLSWLRFSDHHEGQAAWPSFLRCCKSTSTVGALIMLLGFSLGAIIIPINHYQDRINFNRQAPAISNFFMISQLVPFVPLWAVLFALYVAGRLIKGARRVPQVVCLPPICEGCGYDISHQPPESYCPECSRGVVNSLTPGSARNPSTWERSNNRIGSFFATSWQVLRSPSLFYSTLTMNIPNEQAERFRAIQLFVIAFCAAIWAFIFSCIESSGRQWEFVVFLSLLAFTLVPLVGWFYQHVLAALVFTWWLIRKSLPDPRWARRVFAYDTVYLWFHCAFSGVLLSSYFLFDDWIGSTFGESFTYQLIGMPPEPFVFLVGNGLLCLLWLYRYHLAMKAIRWANF